jgi:uncharacterized protein
VYITGSNAKMLSSEISTTLGGRYMVQPVFPFSFQEYLTAQHFSLPAQWEYLQNSDLKRAFLEYFHIGGLLFSCPYLPFYVNLGAKIQHFPL